MTAPYLDSMRLDERYADAAARAESLSNQLADLRDVFESLGLPSYADVASEMADTLTVQSIHMKRFEAESAPRPVLVECAECDWTGRRVDEYPDLDADGHMTPGILAELEVGR